MYELLIDFNKDTTLDKLFLDFIYNWFIDKDHLAFIFDNYNVNHTTSKTKRKYYITTNSLNVIFMLGVYWKEYQESIEYQNIIKKSPEYKKYIKNLDSDTLNKFDNLMENFTKGKSSSKLKYVKPK